MAELIGAELLYSLLRDTLSKPARLLHADGNYDVTIVTVVLNAIAEGRTKRFLQCIDSVQRQEGIRLEHLVIDGASVDGTVELVKGYDNRKVDIRLLSRADSGIYDAMNRGIEMARGKYVAFLNSDDYYNDPVGLSDAIKRLEQTGCDFSYAPAHVLRAEDDKEMDHPNAHPRVGRIFVNMEFSHQSVVTRRDTLIAARGFDLRYKSAADYDLILRLIFTGHRACCVSRPFVTFRMGGFSSVNIVRSQAETATIFSRLFSRYAGIRLAPEECLRIYLSACLPLGLKERLFAYYVSAFGAEMLAIETGCDEIPSGLHELVAFKHGLLPLKRGLRLEVLLRCVCPTVVRHPLWFVEFAFRYRKAIRLVGRKDAARMAFNDMGRRLYKRGRKCADLRTMEKAGALCLEEHSAMQHTSLDLALPVRTRVSPSDFWNVYGTYDVEPWGVWAAKNMLLKTRIPYDYVGGCLSANLIVGGYVFAESPKRVLSIDINGCKMPTIDVDHVEPRSHQVDIPADMVTSQVLEIRLCADSDFVPIELGHSTDDRRLGIAFGGLEICRKGTVK